MCRHTGENFLCLLHRQTRQTNSELRQRRSRPQKHTKSSCEGRASWSCLQRPPLAQLVWAAAEAAATSTWVLRPLGGSRREKRTYQACAPTPHYDSAEQQQRSFWGTVDMVASRPQGSPLRRDAQAGDRAVAVHRRPRDETTQMPAAHPR